MGRIIIILASVMMGCSIEAWQINDAIKYCKDRGGIYKITDAGTSKPVVICKDGKYKNIHDIP